MKGFVLTLSVLGVALFAGVIIGVAIIVAVTS